MRPRWVRNQNAPAAEITTVTETEMPTAMSEWSIASPRPASPQASVMLVSVGLDGSATELSWNSATGFTAVPTRNANGYRNGSVASASNSVFGQLTLPIAQPRLRSGRRPLKMFARHGDEGADEHEQVHRLGGSVPKKPNESAFW